MEQLGHDAGLHGARVARIAVVQVLRQHSRGFEFFAGGILAHASCLSREYGLPAVQLANAMRRIPDGARIRVDGTGGKIVVLTEPDAATEVTA